MKRILVIFVTLLFISAATIAIIGNTSSTTITEFIDRDTEKMFNFPSGGGNITENLKIPRNVPIHMAYFNVSNVDDGSGNYPTNVTLDVGRDGDLEWAFYGTGYGAMGRQNYFYDGLQSQDIVFYSGGTDSSSKLKLPVNASITSAGLSLTGKIKDQSERNYIDANEPYIMDMCVADIDNDTDDDVVITIQNWIWGNGTVQWYENVNGDGTVWTVHMIDSSISDSYQIAAGDLDGDIDIDIAITSPNINNVYWYENLDGKGTSWSSSKSVGIVNTPLGIFIADMNNNGNSDILVTTYGGACDVYLFNNTNGDGSSWSTQTLGSLTYAFGLTVGDIDSDGDNDTVVTDYSWNWPNQLVYWYENLDGNATSWSLPHYIDQFTQYPMAVDVGDIDKDGNPDVAVITDYDIAWYEAPNNPTTTSWPRHFVDSVNSWAPYGDVYLGDLGTSLGAPDGNLDLVANSYGDTEVRWYENDGTPTNGGWGKSVIESDPLNWTSFNNVFLGNMDGQDYIDIVATADTSGVKDIMWYELESFYPTNVTLDVGSNTNIDWVGPTGMFDTSDTITDLANELNNILTSATIVTSDEYGNCFVEIDLKLISETPGIVTVDNIDITYDYSTMVNLNPYTGHLANELEELVFGVQTPEVTIPLTFYSETEGKLKVDGIFIEYNAFPTLTRELPSDRSIDEDSVDDRVMDLSEYFSDDYLAPTELTYNVVKNSKSSIIDVYVTELEPLGGAGARATRPYLGVDCLNGTGNDNWFGAVEVRVNATDDEGLTVESNDFIITIDPLNDEPIVGAVKIPNITFYEGGISTSVFLADSYYFYDIENDRLYYNYTVDPDNEYQDEQLEVDIDPTTNELRVASLNDWWYGEKIPLRIFCDDDPSFEPADNPYQDIYVNIIGLNDDAPQWSTIPDKHIPEDTPTYDAIDLETYVTDVDDAVEELIFAVISNSESTKLKISLGADNKLDFIPLEENYTGSADVTVRVVDKSGNSQDQSFVVYVDPVNDPPVVIPISPSNNGIVNTLDVTLWWSTLDADNTLEDISYDIYFGTTGSAPLSQSGYLDTTYKLEDLTDETTYYWQVLPKDDTATGTFMGGVHSFKIDTSYQLPTTTLYSPTYGTEISSSSVELSWVGNSPYGTVLTYDVYIDTDPTPTTLVANNQKETSFNFKGLKDGATYYWTVIPFDGNTDGACVSGIWEFDVNIKNYGINVSMTVNQITIRQGAQATYEVYITNNGNDIDLIIPGLDANRLGDNIQLESMGELLSLESGEDITLILTLNIPDQKAPNTYIITITATSEGSGLSDSIDIPVKVIERPVRVDEDKKGEGLVYIAIGVVILIVFFILLFLFNRKRRLDAEESELEVLPGVGAPGMGMQAMPPIAPPPGAGLPPATPQPPMPQYMPAPPQVPVLPPAPMQPQYPQQPPPMTQPEQYPPQYYAPQQPIELGNAPTGYYDPRQRELY